MPSAFNSSLADPPRVLVGEILSGSLITIGVLSGAGGSGLVVLLDPSGESTDFFGMAASGLACSGNEVVLAASGFDVSGSAFSTANVSMSRDDSALSCSGIA